MQKKSRYNLIYIFPDQLGYKWLGCAGNPLIKTPNIDQFAKENYNFNSAYSNSPVCTPYRGILFTGKYPSQTKITNNGHSIVLVSCNKPFIFCPSLCIKTMQINFDKSYIDSG